MKSKYVGIGVAWVAFACANAIGATETSQRSAGEGQFLERSGAAVPRQYIVVLRDDPGARLERLDPWVSRFAASKRIAITHVWRSVLNGVLISNVDAADARALAKVGGVLSVEPDSYLSSATTQSNAPAGLDLVDQRTLTPNGTYIYNYTGAGVHAYVVDQGIWTAHPDFGGRADRTMDFVGDGQLDDGGDQALRWRVRSVAQSRVSRKASPCIRFAYWMQTASRHSATRRERELRRHQRDLSNRRSTGWTGSTNTESSPP